jgi:predicted RNA-binding protein with RPS1 domain
MCAESKTALRAYGSGEHLQGRVIKLAPFGAFIELPNGSIGLAELVSLTADWQDPTHWVTRSPADYVAVGEVVGVEVIAVTEEGQSRLKLIQPRTRVEARQCK